MSFFIRFLRPLFTGTVKIPYHKIVIMKINFEYHHWKLSTVEKKESNKQRQRKQCIFNTIFLRFAPYSVSNFQYPLMISVENIDFPWIWRKIQLDRALSRFAIVSNETLCLSAFRECWFGHKIQKVVLHSWIRFSRLMLNAEKTS